MVRTQRGAGCAWGCLPSPQSSQGEVLKITLFSCSQPPKGFLSYLKVQLLSMVVRACVTWCLPTPPWSWSCCSSELPLLPQALPVHCSAWDGAARSWLSANSAE